MSLAIVCTARPSYSKLRPVIRALVTRDVLPTLYMTSGTLLHRFGRVLEQAQAEFPYLRIVPVFSEYDGYTVETSAKSTASLLASLSDAFTWEKPDLVLVNHDRREVLAAAQAASYMNIPVAHIGGGEHSGNIDDKVRDAITCLADRHFPATLQAAQRVMLLTLTKDQEIQTVGCPSIDIAREAVEKGAPVTMPELGGVGPTFDLSQPFLVVLQHAETEQPEEAFRQMQTTLNAVRATKVPTIVFWPGSDAGAEGAAKAIRLHQSEVHTVRTLPPDRFLKLLDGASCLIGNSSAGMREATYLGTPVVNIGQRQRNREHGPQVQHAPHDYDAIRAAITDQLTRVYPCNLLYGDGYSADRIAEALTA
jgi:GDP/UDP-N,N'-diacetylbacillosamine 2-epimerase (hydrolysing)